MLTVDGSFGEGGGQILRSTLALSIITRTPVRLEKIRARRSKPGLKRQHLTAVRAAAAICGGSVTGDEIGSRSITFEPGEVSPGDYHFSIGTAGSTTLVLQTVLPALLRGTRPTTLRLEGGTHNPHAPPFDFLKLAFAPLIHRMGPRIDLHLERAGFFPAGGGSLVATITPTESLRGIEILERGERRARRGRAIVANLPRHIAEREVRVLQKRLGWRPSCFTVQEIENSAGPGNVVLLEHESENICEVITSFGEVRRPAETVASHAVSQLRRYLKSEAPVGEHLTDQLLLPLAIAGSGRFRSTGLSLHARTQIEVVRQFLDVEIHREDLAENDVLVSVERKA